VGAWILGLLAVGAGPALLLQASTGSSQLFFAYNGLVLLYAVGGVGAVALARTRRPLLVACGLVALPFLAAGAGETAGAWRENWGARAVRGRLWPEWIEGIRWLRAEAESDAMLVARHEALLGSAFAERRSVLELQRYRPEYCAACWKRVDGEWQLLRRPETDPFARLARARDAVLSGGGEKALERLRAITGHRGRFYLLCDAVSILQIGVNKRVMVRPRPDCAALEASPLLERCFENEAIAIYRTRE
jgi:hypothetical protein